MFLKVIFLFAAIVLSFTSVFGNFRNPVLDTTSADPYIYLHTDGFYYFVLSAEGGIVVMKNNILTNWRRPLARQKVYDIPAGNANLWAPEIHYIGNQFYIYFTMGTGEIPTQRMWVIQALDPNDPLGEFSQATRLVPPSEDYYQIDGTVVQYGNNSDTLYMMWSGCDVEGIDNPTNMYIAPMQSPTEVGNRVLLRSRTQTWEGTVIEGPQVIWKDSRLVIIFSANHYTTSEYCLGLMSIDDYKDPLIPANWYQKLDAPVFYKNEEEGVFGPGHASFTYSRDGREGWIAYHAMQVPMMPDDHDNRTTRVERYIWGSDGYPILPRPSRLGTPIADPI